MWQQVRNAKVLIVEDHPIVRAGLVRLLSQEADMQICGEAEGTGEALGLVRTVRPDLVLIDLLLKNGSGLDLCRQLAALHAGPRLLVLSAQDENLYAERALRAGAHGFVSKEASPAQLLEAIRAVLAGRVWLPPRIAERVMQRVARREDPAQCPIELLADRELEIFELLGHGLTTHQIAARLHLSPKTIDSHRERLKAKLNVRNSTELVHRALLWVLEERHNVPCLRIPYIARTR